MTGDSERAAEVLSARRRAGPAHPFAPLGEQLQVLATCESTNDLAKRAAKEGAPHGATWVADVQTAGRGRQGRPWSAEPGEALLFSVLARVSCPPQRLPLLALAAGLAVRDAVARSVPAAAPRIKWPNDVVAAGTKKIAGILVEAATAGERASAVVIGVGVNVHTRSFPDAIAARATSVAACGGAADRAELLADILLALERDVALVAAHGLAPVHERLRAADVLYGARVKNDSGDAGCARGVDDEGRLLVARDDGVLARWSAGEVHLV